MGGGSRSEPFLFIVYILFVYLHMDSSFDFYIKLSDPPVGFGVFMELVRFHCFTAECIVVYSTCVCIHSFKSRQLRAISNRRYSFFGYAVNYGPAFQAWELSWYIHIMYSKSCLVQMKSWLKK